MEGENRLSYEKNKAIKVGWRSSRWSVLCVVSLAVFIDMYLYAIIVPLLPMIIEKANVPSESYNFYKDLLYSSYGVGLFVSTPFLAIYSDRSGQRRIPMLFGLFALAGSTLIFAFLQNFWLLVLARIAQGVAACTTWVMGFAMLADVFPAVELGTAFGISMGCHTAGELAGLVAGGELGDRFGVHVPFMICVLLTILDFIGRLVIKSPEALDANPCKKKVNMLDLIRNREVSFTLGVTIITSCSICSIENKMSDWLGKPEWGLKSTMSSRVMLALLIPQVFVSPIIGYLSDRLSRRLIILLGLLIHAPLPLLVFMTAGSWNLLILASVFYGVVMCVIKTPVSPALGEIVDRMGSASFAQLYGLVNMAFCIGMLIGPYTVSIISERSKLIYGMIVIGLLSLIYAPAYYTMTRPRGRINSTSSLDKKNDYA